MTDDEKELKLQAFFDGELPEAEAREVASWLAKDRGAADLHKELRNTRQALAGFEKGINVPESREFYWSKIAREIERTEQAQPVRTRVSLLTWLRRLLLPVVGVAAIITASVFLWRPTPTEAEPGFDESTFDDCGAVTFRNEEEGTTIVWFSYDTLEHQQQNQNTTPTSGNQ